MRFLAAGFPLVLALSLLIPSAVHAKENCAPRADVEAARSAAKACGDDVEALDAHTEFDRVFAQPDGAMRLESAAGPQWVKNDEGTWVDIDTRLRADTNGRLAPAATLMEVSFSSGGSGPLVEVVAGDHSFTLASPIGELPEPIVDGDTATYADVAPGADIVVRATPTGFGHEIVVKSADAAKSQAIREIRYATGGDLSLLKDGQGGVRLVGDGQVVASAPGAMMWDSSRLDDSSSKTKSGEGQEHVGDGAKAAPVDVDVAEDELVLTPDHGLLDNPDATYPIRIDPYFSSKPSRWAYANDVNDNHGADPANASARVGRDPSNGWLYRSAFAFPVTKLRGTEILDVKFTVTLYHSWSCHADPQPTYLYRSHYPDKTPRESWKNAYLGDYIGSNSDTSNKASCFSDPTPDAAWHTSTLKSEVTDAVAEYSTVTLALSAKSPSSGGESTQSRWKKYKQDSARLVVTYNTPPDKPTSLTVGRSACGSGGVTTNDPTPQLSAKLKDDDRDTLTGHFEYRSVGGTITTASDSGVKSGDYAAISTKTLDNGVYEWRIRAKDSRVYGSWSSWCGFTVDKDAPDPPLISSNDYGECTVDSCMASGGPGEAGEFTFTAANADVTAFLYGWSSPPKNTAATLDGAAKTLLLTPPVYGENVLFVQTKDAAGNASSTASYTFAVDRAAPPIAAWGMEKRPGIDDALANANSDGESLTTHGAVNWSENARLIGAQTAQLNGGHLSTTTKTVDTDGSFSVSAWTRLDNTNDHSTVVSQAGDHRPGFYLKYNVTKNRWSFETPTTDSSETSYEQALSNAEPKVGQWTLLTGVYDASDRTIQLYVNGKPQSSAPRSSPWAAKGRLLVGAAGDTANETWSPMAGGIAGVQIFDRAVVTEDFTVGSDDLRPLNASELAGSWTFNEGVGTEIADHSAWNRELSLAGAVEFGTGYDWDGFDLQFPGIDPVSAAAGGPIVRTDSSFTVSAWARLDGDEHHATVLSQAATHRPAFYLKYNDTKDVWSFEMPTGDSADTAYAQALSKAPPSIGEWTHLAGIYDAATGEIRLYVNGELQSTVAHIEYWHVPGQFLVGTAGSTDGTTWSPMEGGVDDPSVYIGALADSEIKSMYLGQSSASNA